jgi:hypothetical protein
MAGMSARGYARSRGIDERQVRRKISEGAITRDANGQVNEAQADAALLSIRRGSRLGVHQLDDAGRRSARAKIAMTVAKLRFAKERFDTAREQLVDRAEAIEVAGREADYVIEALRAAPNSLAAEAFAAEIAIEPAVAQAILERFVSLTLSEIGDLRGQAIRDAERT